MTISERVCLACAAVIVASACADGNTLSGVRQGILYGRDDRQDAFEVTDRGVRARLEASVVALLPRSALREQEDGVTLKAPTWGEAEQLCADEPFQEQPAAAFCSGVLVDYDLVLTAGHCLRLFGLADFVVAFGYSYASDGVLELVDEDIFEPVEIVDEALDPAGMAPRDYGFIRLDRAVTAPREPAPIVTSPAALQPGALLRAMSTCGGTPIKVDQGGSILGVDPGGVFFRADTDTSHGSSGGPAFDQDLNLVGVLARGGTDLEETAEHCYRSRQAEGDDGEQFTLASTALTSLCAHVPDAASICRSACGEPCSALAPLHAAAHDCTVTHRAPSRLAPAFVSLLLAAVALFVRRGRAARRSGHVSLRRCPRPSRT
jgi:hypothetical protein